MEKKPWLKRSSPVPPHCGQARSWVPGLAPEPLQVEQREARGMLMVVSAPNAASSKPISRLKRRSETPLCGPPAAPPAAEDLREQVAEDVVDGAREAPEPAKALEGVGAHPGVPELVVLGPLAGVGEDGVGLGRLLELLLRLLVARVAVGVELQRLLAVCALDLVGGGGLRDLEHLVVVALGAGWAHERSVPRLEALGAGKYSGFFPAGACGRRRAQGI
jgi:hypothetical protein